MTPLEEIVARYRALGRVVLPVPRGAKRAGAAGWSDPAKVDFPIDPSGSVAWRLDALADVDLDRREAILMARHVLPPTGALSGRPSIGAPSHFFYLCDGAAYRKFEDPVGGAAILEVRAGTSHYTLVPPSLMPASKGNPEETARWYAEGEPASVEAAAVARRAALLASCVIVGAALGRHGFGHAARLDVFGALARLGLAEEELVACGRALSDLCENAETDDVPVAAKTTLARMAKEGAKVRGMTALAARLGDAGPAIAKALRSWLGAPLEEAEWPAGFAPLTEAGDAEHMARRQAADLRFDWGRGRWLMWDAHTWRPRTDGEITRLALAACRSRQEEALRLQNDEARRGALKWALAGESRARLDNLAALARAIRPVSDDGSGWDANPWLLGAPNGVIDLRTGEIRAGDPGDKITMRIGAPYDPSAEAPTWDRAILEIFDGDADLIAYFDRLVGYSLTGDCREEALAVCWGGGANGKGTLMNTLAKALGDYADDVPFTMFELGARSGIPNDVAKIDGKRYVTSSETGETARLNEARVKALTGRDPITARFLHKEFFTFQPVSKFWLATNHRPIVHDDSPGFWRRIHLLPFTVNFEERPGGPDKTLKERLLGELPGVVARAVRGVAEWRRHGLAPPDRVRAASAEWRADSDPLAPFLEDECVIAPGARVGAGELHRAYSAWCGRRNDKNRLSQVAFGRKIRERFKATGSDSHGWKYEGVGLLAKDAATPPPEF